MCSKDISKVKQRLVIFFIYLRFFIIQVLKKLSGLFFQTYKYWSNGYFIL